MSTPPPTVPYSANPGEPTLADVLTLHKKDILLNFASHHIGVVQGFDEEQQTCKATINYKQTFFVRAPSGQYVPRLVDYPVLVNCPAVILAGAEGALTMGDLVGQDCLILFNDRDLDNWFQGNSNTAPATSRLHSFSDGLILVGVRSLANSLENYDTLRPMLRSRTGETQVGINPESQKILLTNTAPANTSTLYTKLADLVAAIKAMTISPGTFSNSGGPVTGAGVVSAGSQIVLQAAIDAIEELLE